MGSMLTALAGFLQAKSKHGLWLLRIDDIDTPRVAAGAVDAIRRTLERYGLQWDQTEFIQSKRLEPYHQALGKLESLGLLYPCTCSRKSLANLHEPGMQSAAYPGICRHARRLPNFRRMRPRFAIRATGASLGQHARVSSTVFRALR